MTRSKSILVATAVTLAVILLLLGAFRLADDEDVPKPEPAFRPVPQTSNPAAASGARGTPAAIAPGEAESAPVTLQGRDFTVTVLPGENPDSLAMRVVMASGAPVRDWVGHDGEVVRLENLIHGRLDEFELKDLIPGAGREQIVQRGRVWIPQGGGALNTYSIIKVEPERLVEVLDLITGRETYGEDGEPQKRLEAKVIEKSADGRPVIEYRYSVRGAPERTLTFNWDGKTFVEPTGEYATIERSFGP